MQGALGLGLQALGQLVEHVGQPVDPAALLARLGPHLPDRHPKAQRAVAHRHHRRPHPAPFEIAKHRRPALLALTVAVLNSEELLGPVGTNPNHDKGAQAILFQTDTEVDPVHPDVDVVELAQVSPLKFRMLPLPLGRQPRDRRRRQARRIFSQQNGQRFAEIARGETPQVEHRQHLGHLGRAPHVGRKNPARKTLLAAQCIHAPVVDPRGVNLHGARTQGDLPRPGLAVSHHQRSVPFVPLVPMVLDVGSRFRLHRHGQHPPGALACYLVQHPSRLFALPICRAFDYLEHGWRLLPPGSNQERVGCPPTRKVTPPFSCPQSTTFGNNSIPLQTKLYRQTQGSSAQTDPPSPPCH